MNLKKLTAIILEKNKTYGLQEGQPDNRRLVQWRVKWLIEHATSHQSRNIAGWCIDSFVLRNPPLRQAP
jgi:hypothetical protein